MGRNWFAVKRWIERYSRRWHADEWIQADALFFAYTRAEYYSSLTDKSVAWKALRAQMRPTGTSVEPGARRRFEASHGAEPLDGTEVAGENQSDPVRGAIVNELLARLESKCGSIQSIVIRLKKEGHDLRAIARQLGVCYSTVQRRWNELRGLRRDVYGREGR